MKNGVHGALYQKGGRYYARTYYYENGKRKTKDAATGILVDGGTKRKTEQYKRAAEQFLAAFIVNFAENNGKQHNTSPADQMLVDTAQAWLEHVSVSRAPGTISSYTTIVRDLGIYFSALHPKRTADVTTLDVEQYLDWERMRRQPGYEGEYKVNSRSPDGAGIENTVHHRYTALRSILQFARREKIVSYNVASARENKINTPKPQKQEFPIYTPEEARKLLINLHTEPRWFQVAVCLGLLFGLRRSEVIGLKESDIDWSTAELIVRYTVTQQTLNHKNQITGKPFTKNRKPKVFLLGEQECVLFKALINEHHLYKQQFGLAYDDTWEGHLIRYPDGKLVSPNTLTRKFKEFLQRNGCKEIRFHDLRHSCASILCENGVDIKTIQEIMGHLQLSTTMMYLHHSKGRKAAALSQMHALIQPTLTANEEVLKN